MKLGMRCKLIEPPSGSNRTGENYQASVWGFIVLARDEYMGRNSNEPVTFLSKDGDIEMDCHVTDFRVNPDTV